MRKGISFTLTLVVIGVVLLMTALTVIVVGGGEVSSFFQRGGEASLDAAVAEECGQLADSINNNYCDYYTNQGDCTDVRRNPSNDYESTASQEGCDWQADGGDRVEQLLDGGEPVVTVQGNEYNCFEENEMTSVCPA